MTRIQTGFAVRRTSTVRGTSTDCARIQIATPLITMPSTVRRSVCRFMPIGAGPQSRSARGASGGRAVSFGERRTRSRWRR